MALVSENLLALDGVKQAIKTAIEEKGQDMKDVPFTEYAQKITDIKGKRFTTGTVIFSEIKGVVTVTHGLGVKPSIFLMLPKDKTLNFTVNAENQPQAGIYGAYYINLHLLENIFLNSSDLNLTQRNSTLEWRANNSIALHWEYSGAGVTENGVTENTIELGYRSAVYKYIAGLEYEWIAIE